MKPDLQSITSLLFVPGHRPDRFDKARAASPQGIVIDLEDAVPPERKDEARRTVSDYLRQSNGGAPLFVRLNPLGTPPALHDLAALADGNLPVDGLFLAKVEEPRDLAIVRAYDRKGLPLIAAIETGAGIDNARAVAAAMRPGEALGFGGADLAADLGCAFDWEPLFAARSALVRAAAGRGLGVLDVPYLDIGDQDGLVQETLRVRALGFTGKLAIHPSQVAAIAGAFRPTPAEIERAHRIVAAIEGAEGGAAQLDGKMIDAPLAAAARRTLAIAKLD